MFIQLQEYYYKNGMYLTKPMYCNINEISSIQTSTDDYGIEYVLLRMNNGSSFKIKDTYTRIKSKLDYYSSLYDKE